MATPKALERVAFKAAEDAWLDGWGLAEFHIVRLLSELHGAAAKAALEAMLAGLARLRRDGGLPCGSPWNAIDLTASMGRSPDAADGMARAHP